NMNHKLANLAKRPGQLIPSRPTLKQFCASIVGVALGGLFLVKVDAQTYDVVADFSTNSNPNGVWSYRYTIGSSRDGNYALLPAYAPAYGGFDQIGIWTANGTAPQVGVNLTGQPVAFQGSGFVWPASAMLVHPGANGPVVVSWQSPFNMLVDIAFSF